MLFAPSQYTFKRRGLRQAPQAYLRIFGTQKIFSHDFSFWFLLLHLIFAITFPSAGGEDRSLLSINQLSHSVRAKPLFGKAHQGDSSLVFFHIPKTGGTTLEIEIKRLNPEIKDFDASYYGCSDALCPAEDCDRCPAYHCPPRSFQEKGVAVARNPVDRIISEYKYRLTLMQDKNRRKKFCTCKGFKRFFMRRFAHYEPSMFKDKHLRQRVGCHFIPQVEWLYKVKHVLLFENLKNDLDSLLTNQNVTNEFILERNNVGWNCTLLKSCLMNDQEFKNKFDEFYSEDLQFWKELAKQRIS